MRFLILSVILALPVLTAEAGADDDPDIFRDILVTFDNSGARSSSGGLSAPYRNRKRYSIPNSVRRDANAIAEEHKLVEIDHWPIRSLSVYCFVYRVSSDADRDSVIERLSADVRVESAQALQLFNTGSSTPVDYDDTYANLQYGLHTLDIVAAHRLSKGSGITVAIVDSNADTDHEDLRGRISKQKVFARDNAGTRSDHGTAVASIIGARSNNARGIVGVAPEADLEVFASCWSDGDNRPAICDSFTLLKALDAILDDPPQVLNMSLAGPQDPLLRRILTKAIDAGVVVVAASPIGNHPQKQFPASMEGVIGVGRSDQPAPASPLTDPTSRALYAPGDRIIVAAPEDSYDFKSGSSLSAAHVSGVIALLLGASPHLSSDAIQKALFESQDFDAVSNSVNACRALNIVDMNLRC